MNDYHLCRTVCKDEPRKLAGRARRSPGLVFFSRIYVVQGPQKTGAQNTRAQNTRAQNTRAHRTTRSDGKSPWKPTGVQSSSPLKVTRTLGSWELYPEVFRGVSRLNGLLLGGQYIITSPITTRNTFFCRRCWTASTFSVHLGMQAYKARSVIYALPLYTV